TTNVFPYSSAGRTSSRSLGIGFGNRVRLPAEAGLTAGSGPPDGSGVRSNFRLRLYSSSLPMRCILPHAFPGFGDPEKKTPRITAETWLGASLAVLRTWDVDGGTSSSLRPSN